MKRMEAQGASSLGKFGTLVQNWIHEDGLHMHNKWYAAIPRRVTCSSIGWVSDKSMLWKI